MILSQWTASLFTPPLSFVFYHPVLDSSDGRLDGEMLDEITNILSLAGLISFHIPYKDGRIEVGEKYFCYGKADIEEVIALFLKPHPPMVNRIDNWINMECLDGTAMWTIKLKWSKRIGFYSRIQDIKDQEFITTMNDNPIGEGLEIPRAPDSERGAMGLYLEHAGKGDINRDKYGIRGNENLIEHHQWLGMYEELSLWTKALMLPNNSLNFSVRAYREKDLMEIYDYIKGIQDNERET